MLHGNWNNNPERLCVIGHTRPRNSVLCTGYGDLVAAALNHSQAVTVSSRGFRLRRYLGGLGTCWESFAGKRKNKRRQRNNPPVLQPTTPATRQQPADQSNQTPSDQIIFPSFNSGTVRETHDTSSPPKVITDIHLFRSIKRWSSRYLRVATAVSLLAFEINTLQDPPTNRGVRHRPAAPRFH